MLRLVYPFWQQLSFHQNQSNIIQELNIFNTSIMSLKSNAKLFMWCFFTTFCNQATVIEPQMVVDFVGEKAIYYTEKLEEIIHSAKAEETQVYIICITGVFRTGKSFFLSLFKTYLDYICVVNIIAILTKK